MAANGIVRFNLIGDSRAFRNALRGATDEALRADQATARSAQSSARTRTRAWHESADTSENDAQRVAAQYRDADNAIVRSAQQRAREQSRLARQTEREQREQMRRSRQLMQMAVGGGIGAAAAVGAQISGYSSTLGVPSRDQMISSFIQNQQQLIRLAATTNGQYTGAQLQERVAQVSTATNVDQVQLVHALEVGQNRFSDLGFFADNLEAIARAAQTGNGDIADYVGVLGEFRRQMGTTGQDTDQVLGSLIQMMTQGSIEAGDFAANFGTMMGTFVNLRGGAAGVGQAREFMAVAEALGSGGVGGDVARTQMGEVMSLLHRRDARAHMERLLGNDVFDRQGRLQISFGELTQRMAEHGDQFTTPEGLSRIFGHGRTGRVPEEAVRALTTLVNLDVARLEGRSGRAATISELMSGSASTGNALIDQTNAELMGSASGRALGLRMEAEANFDRNGDRVVETMRSLVGPMVELETQYPLLTEGMVTLRNAAMGAGVSLSALALLGGAGGVGGAAGGAGALGTLGTTAAGVLGTGAVAALGAAGAAGAVTLYANEAGDSHLYNEAGAARQRTATSLGQALEQGGGHAAFSEVMRTLDPSQRAAFSAAAQRDVAQGITLSEATVRALATEIGRSTSTAIARGAPADGRTAGVPGRS